MNEKVIEKLVINEPIKLYETFPDFSIAKRSEITDLEGLGQALAKVQPFKSKNKVFPFLSRRKR